MSKFIAASLLVTKSRKPPNKKAARASEARAQSRVNGTTQSFVACYSIVLAGASERERIARVCLSKQEFAEWLGKEAICR